MEGRKGNWNGNIPHIIFLKRDKKLAAALWVVLAFMTFGRNCSWVVFVYRNFFRI